MRGAAAWQAVWQRIWLAIQFAGMAVGYVLVLWWLGAYDLPLAVAGWLWRATGH